MGLLDKAKALLGQHEEKVEGAIEKVADVVDDKTGGKYADKIEKGVESAKGFIGDDAEHVAVGDDEGETGDGGSPAPPSSQTP